MRIAGLVVVLSVALSGCATLMAAGPDHVPITTNPPGATVYVDNMPVGATPVMVTMDRERSGGVIRIEAPGFMPITLVRNKGVNGWFWVNIVLLSPLGVIIDLATGNWKSFDDSPIVLGLVPAGGAGAPPPGYPPQPPPPPGYPPPPPR